MKRIALSIPCLLLAFSLASAQGKPSSAPAVAAYRGADREEFLKAGAKKEGKVMWYTTLIAYKEIAAAFESKYPGVRVESYRANSTDLIKRFMTEAQARRHIADVIESTPPMLMASRDAKLITPYFSPNLSHYPDDAKEEADKNTVFWTTDRESLIGLGFNNRMIKAAEAPKSFSDLVKPHLKGRMGISGDATGARMIGAILQLKGEEFVKQLRNQEMKLYMVSGGALHELMAAGEIAVAPSIFRNHVWVAREKGAPSEWLPLDVVPANAGGAAIPTHSNSPHAAMLFIDFLISPEGQKLLEEKFKFASSMKNYGFKRWYPEKGLTTEQYEKNFNRWQKLVREISRK
jgi:iron(III) transport system substrate-binding protein